MLRLLGGKGSPNRLDETARPAAYKTPHPNPCSFLAAAHRAAGARVPTEVGGGEHPAARVVLSGRAEERRQHPGAAHRASGHFAGGANAKF